MHHGPMARLTSAFMLVLAVPSVALAAPVGYAQATGYYKQSSRPTLYQPLNLLDGRETTGCMSVTSSRAS